MSVKLYMDVHVKRAVTDGLRRRGVDVLAAQEDGATGLEDADLLDRATALGRVLFNQDDDLPRNRQAKSIESLVFTLDRRSGGYTPREKLWHIAAVA